MKKRLAKKNIKIMKGCAIVGTHFSGHNYIGVRSFLTNSKIGRYSYISNNCSFDHALIGSFCSIGNDVKLVAAQHPTSNFVSTSPVFYDKSSNIGSFTSGQQLFPDYKFVPGTNYKVIIGDDVWIGDNCLIIGGVKIGTGAIIAASAVVTKDVEPYAIVGGVPAKVIRFRFTKEQIDKILQSAWWEKSGDWLRSHLNEMKNVDTFCQLLGQDKQE